MQKKVNVKERSISDSNINGNIQGDESQKPAPHTQNIPKPKQSLQNIMHTKTHLGS